MYEKNQKCVIVIDETLPIGIIANTSAILGITLGAKVEEIVGDNVMDKTGNSHLGIIKIPIPILKATTETIKAIHKKLYEHDFYDLTTVDFTDLAQSCKTYDEFVERMNHTQEKDLKYIGLAIYGSKNKINKLTGNIPLLR